MYWLWGKLTPFIDSLDQVFPLHSKVQFQNLFKNNNGLSSPLPQYSRNWQPSEKNIEVIVSTIRGLLLLTAMALSMLLKTKLQCDGSEKGKRQL